MQNRKGEIYSLNLAQCQKEIELQKWESLRREKKGKEIKKSQITIDKRRP